MTDKPICPHYNEDSICDCPYESVGTIGFIFAGVICPPAEQIKDNLLERYIEARRMRGVS